MRMQGAEPDEPILVVKIRTDFMASLTVAITDRER